MPDYSKNKVLALLDYLQKNTDKNHPVTMKQIQAHMEACGYPYSRATAMRNIKQLREELGVDIISTRGNNAVYYIGERLFQKSELKFIIDSINASNFIEKETAKDLADKLRELVSRYEAEELNRNVSGVNIAKTENEKVLQNVDAIQEALNKECQICCHYMKWNTKKELVPKNADKIVINPWRLIWANDRYYLYGYVMKNELEERCYRVDKLAEIEVLEKKRKGADKFKEFHADTYVSRRMGLFSGEEKNIKVRVSVDLVGPIIDQFGKNETSIEETKDGIEVSFRAATSNNLYGWLIGLGDVEVISPPSVRKEMQDLIQKNISFYKNIQL